MKKIFVSLFLVFIIFTFSENALAENNYFENSKETYDEFLNAASEYDNLNITQTGETQKDKSRADRIFEKIYEFLFSEIKASVKILFSVVFICMLGSLIKVFVTKQSLAEAGEFGIYCMCGGIVISGFKTITDICNVTIKNLSDFMDIAVPTYASLLVGSGFGSLAVSMQSLFMVISVFITHIIKNLICPLLFCCGLVSVAGGISSAIDISKFIKLFSKTVKYILGIVMTIFAGIITFSGLSSSAADSLTVTTAKFAVSNFVPVVGGCLSSVLNGITQSSVALKNNLGYIGFLVLFSICIIPVIKVFVLVISFKLSASLAQIFSETKLGTMLDSVCEVLVTMGALVLLVTSVFVLIIGVIASVGL